jgi:hypothetical protein
MTGDSYLTEFDPSKLAAMAGEATRRMIAMDQWVEVCGRMAHDLALDVSRHHAGVIADDHSPGSEGGFALTIPRIPLGHERELERAQGGSAEVYVRRWLWDSSEPRGGRFSRAGVVLCDPVEGYRWEAGGVGRSMPASTPYSVLVAAVVADTPTEPGPMREEEEL